MVQTRAAQEPDCRFIAHLHGRLGPQERGTMEAALRTAFAAGRGYKPRVGDLTFEYCDAARHAMWPQAARIAPLLDDGTEATVVLVDVHDPLDAQREAVERLDGVLPSLPRCTAPLLRTSSPVYVSQASWPLTGWRSPFGRRSRASPTSFAASTARASRRHRGCARRARRQ